MVTVQWLTELLAEIDPEGLTSMGAPADEYSGEAGYIMAYIRKIGPSEITRRDLKAFMIGLFVMQFGWTSVSEETITLFSDLTNQIWERLTE